MKPYYKYVEDVSNDRIIVGENIKLAINRFIQDMKRDDLEFREEVVDKAISFIATLRHFTGKSSGSPFLLEDW
jgi:phage terminase large subunit-like protein